VLIKVRAASVHPDVWHVVTGQPAVLRLMGAGVRHPKEQVPGTDVAGVVESVGRAVTRVPRGSRVLVNGAGGGVGAFAVQLAKAYGAEVTGVDHPAKVALVRSLGADRTLDYTREDFTRGGERWDLIFDVPGNHSFHEIRRAMDPHGSYVLIGHDAFGATGHHWLGSVPRMLGLMARSAVTPELRGGSLASPDKRRLMTTLARFLETGQLRVVIDRTFPLSQASEALRYLVSGQPVGRVVVVVSDPP
jgi:NADPH:quinone reductase-like Zn-dependent oxidoreductase